MIHDIIFRVSLVVYLALVGVLSNITMDTPLITVDVCNLVVILFILNVLRQILPWEYGVLIDCIILVYFGFLLKDDFIGYVLRFLGIK